MATVADLETRIEELEAEVDRLAHIVDAGPPPDGFVPLVDPEVNDG